MIHSEWQNYEIATELDVTAEKTRSHFSDKHWIGGSVPQMHVID